MTRLKSTYPLYLANEAKQPNADLEVTDKYTGKVAFRVALADAATIDAGIAAAVEAAEPMARMASFERQAVLQHCVDRFRERFDELAFALCVEAGKPVRGFQGAGTRLSGALETRSDRAVQLHLPVQLPAQLGRAQGRPGDRRRLPVRDEAGQ